VKLLVVDLSSIFWTLAQSGASAEGNAPRDYSLRDIRETAASGYDRVVVAVDGDDRDEDWPQLPWRRHIWPSYKDRSERAAHHWALLKDTIAHCEAEGWIVMRSPPKHLPDPRDEGRTLAIVGFHEADDVVGAVVAWARKNGHSADIRTGDSDLGQLVRDNDPPVRLLRRHKGQRTALDSAAITEWIGVPPHVVAPLKALAGDGGDGYGGANSPYPGIGHETAIKMLRASKGDAVNAVAMAIASDETNADGKTVPKWIKVCRELGVERAETGLLLARVATDLPLDFSRIEAQPVPKAPPSLPQEPKDAELCEEDEKELADVERDMVADREARRDGANTAMIIAESPRMLMAPRELISRDREIAALIKHSLKNGPPDGTSDYGKIPYCSPKPALFDVGAERLCKVFGLYAKFKTTKEIERLDGDDAFVYYRVRCRLYRVGHDYQVGEQISAACSRESTFAAQRKSVFDLMNPVLSRAQKRAFVKAVLRATGAQKYLSSGFEDLTEAEFGTASPNHQWETK
jgi:5'-3' exonuclease